MMLLLFFVPWLSWASPALKLIEIAPANGISVPYDANTSEHSGCTLSLPQPRVVSVVSETASHFEVEFPQENRGCFLQYYTQNLNMKRGFIAKNDITWRESLPGESESDPLPTPQSIPDLLAIPDAPQSTAPCKSDIQTLIESLPPQEFVPEDPYESEDTVPAGAKGWGIFELIGLLRRQQAGLKSPANIDNYIRCYPYGDNGYKNYKKYAKYIDLAADVFRIDIKNNTYEVHPSLMRCLLRRESGYDPENNSHTGAAGLGQHTDINIKEIKKRINTAGSWEQKLWREFFDRVRKTPGGQKEIKKCLGSSETDRPVFETKDDAKCPLQSIAASSIYNLLIQRELMKSSQSRNIEWEQELDYQLAVAATYNLGNGASRAAVKDLFVGGWLDAIRKKSKKSKDPNKDDEVEAHIRAIRNCMQVNNWKPMAARDKPVCKDFNSLITPHPNKSY